MTFVGYIFMAVLLVAILQSLMAAAMVLCLLALLWGAVFRPRETLGLLFTLLLFGVVVDHPLASISVAVLAYVAVKLGGWHRARGTPHGGATWAAAARQEASWWRFSGRGWVTYCTAQPPLSGPLWSNGWGWDRRRAVPQVFRLAPSPPPPTAGFQPQTAAVQPEMLKFCGPGRLGRR